MAPPEAGTRMTNHRLLTHKKSDHRDDRWLDQKRSIDTDLENTDQTLIKELLALIATLSAMLPTALLRFFSTFLSLARLHILK